MVIIDTRSREAPELSAAEASERTAGPWRTLAVILTAFALGALLNAQSLSETAAAQPVGWQREAAIDLTDGLVGVAETLGLDHPHRWAEQMLGRSDEPGPGPNSEQGRVVFVPTADRPAQLLVAGDSLMDAVGPALVNQAGATGVIAPALDVQYSSGLTRPELFDWPARLTEELVSRGADIVVFMVGANDGQPIETPAGWASFATPEWEREYRQRVATTADLLATHTAAVYWVGQPIPRDEMQAARVSVMNAMYRSVAEEHPAVHFVDAWRLFTDDRGGYSAYLPDESGRMILVRDPDGVHLSPAGADLLAGEILAAISQDWDIEMAD